MRSKILLGLVFSMVFSAAAVLGQVAKPAAVRIITIVTEPKATVWIDDIRRGVTDESGKLLIKHVPAGTRRVRVRATGFKEVSVPLLPAQRGDVKIALTKVTDEAEIAFQEAEVLMTRDRSKAIEAYRKAVALRPRYAEAYVELARALSGAGDYDEALKAVAGARKARPGYAEASAVEGRIYKDLLEEEKAIASFKRAISEAKGFQPEAHTGLGLLYKDKAEAQSLEGDFQASNATYALAASELRIALTQLSGAPDAIDIYQLLGDVYYRARRYKEAIKVYEEFLRIFPDTNEATSIRSLIVQTTREMNGEQ
jgi:tetratricopeptide (TPR) repeat protein